MVEVVEVDSPGGISGDGAAVGVGKEVAAVIVHPVQADHPDRVWPGWSHQSDLFTNPAL
jgi:hypothetical protein